MFVWSVMYEDNCLIGWSMMGHHPSLAAFFRHFVLNLSEQEVKVVPQDGQKNQHLSLQMEEDHCDVT